MCRREWERESEEETWVSRVESKLYKAKHFV